MSRWNDISNENAETGCPKWNGPVRGPNGIYSTYFPGTTNPRRPSRKVRLYKVSRGQLLMKIHRKSETFFSDREYYCRVRTRTCNHDPNIDCTAVNFLGERVTDANGKFKINHDLCKKEPFCIPHYKYVLGKRRPEYRQYAAPHITSRKAFKYGYVEAKVRHANTSAILAVWMSLDTMRDGYCRIRKTEGPNKIREECPSITRSQRWQEIDMAEVMNSEKQKFSHHANVHGHVMYKGEFSSKEGIDNEGGMGGGPIMVRSSLFNQPRPSFGDIPASQKIENRWSYGFGPDVKLDKEWAAAPHILGLYWSPDEIRFYLDGKEVERMSNPLIHMPMTFDLSTSLNPEWAGQDPATDSFSEWEKIYYFRVWKVFTQDGMEPPSDLPLKPKMDSFKNIYGSNLYGIFNRFPVQDNQSDMIPSNPNADEYLMSTDSLGGSTRELDIGNEDVEYLFHSHHKDFINDEIERLQAKVRQEYGVSFSHAGGPGNRLFTDPVSPPMSALQKKIAVSREDRFVQVWANESGSEIIENAAITAFENTDPGMVQAAWAARDAKGNVDFSLLA